MAFVTKVRRVANPRPKAGGVRRRRKMTAKQISHFGTRRQKAALKASRKRKRTRNISEGFVNATGFHPIRSAGDYSSRRAGEKVKRSRKPAGKAGKGKKNPTRRKRNLTIQKRVVHIHHYANPKRKRTSTRKRVGVRSNPAPVILTLGAVNPSQRRISNMARKRRATKRNPSRARSRKVTRIVVAAPKRHRRRGSTLNPRRRSGRKNPRYYARRRNPMFGAAGGDTAKLVAGGLVGVAAAKFLPTLLPSSIVGGTITRVLASGVAAFVAKFVATKAGASSNVSDAILFGGLMQAGSVALNAFLPASLAQRFAMGELTPAQFAVPQNTLKIAAPVTAQKPRVAMSGLNRAFGGSAF